MLWFEMLEIYDSAYDEGNAIVASVGLYYKWSEIYDITIDNNTTKGVCSVE